jgi:hypothetical protein
MKNRQEPKLLSLYNFFIQNFDSQEGIQILIERNIDKIETLCNTIAFNEAIWDDFIFYQLESDSLNDNSFFFKFVNELIEKDLMKRSISKFNVFDQTVFKYTCAVDYSPKKGFISI